MEYSAKRNSRTAVKTTDQDASRTPLSRRAKRIDAQPFVYRVFRFSSVPDIHLMPLPIPCLVLFC
jgi:hypothetical protein